MKKLSRNDIVYYQDRQYTVEFIERKHIDGMEEVMIHLIDEQNSRIQVRYSELLSYMRQNHNEEFQQNFDSQSQMNNYANQWANQWDNNQQQRPGGSGGITDGYGNTSRLVQEVANIEGFSEHDAEEFLKVIFSKMSEIIITTGREVSIAGFGTFVPFETSSRIGTDPYTGKKQRMPKSTVVGFQPEALNKSKRGRNNFSQMNNNFSQGPEDLYYKKPKKTKGWILFLILSLIFFALVFFAIKIGLNYGMNSDWFGSTLWNPLANHDGLTSIGLDISKFGSNFNNSIDCIANLIAIIVAPVFGGLLLLTIIFKIFK